MAFEASYLKSTHLIKNAPYLKSDTEATYSLLSLDTKVFLAHGRIKPLILLGAALADVSAYDALDYPQYIPVEGDASFRGTAFNIGGGLDYSPSRFISFEGGVVYRTITLHYDCVVDFGNCPLSEQTADALSGSTMNYFIEMKIRF